MYQSIVHLKSKHGDRIYNYPFGLQEIVIGEAKTILRIDNSVNVNPIKPIYNVVLNKHL